MLEMWPPSSIWLLWFSFGLTSVVIAVGGYFLLIYADAIADRIQLGRTWVGAVLLATVTSLPELIAAIGAVMADGPDMAAGNVLGSCAFNLSLVFLLDALYRERSVYSRASHSHVLSGSLSIILVGVLILCLALRVQDLDFNLGHVGVDTLFIFVFYGFAMRTLHRFGIQETTIPEEQEAKPGLSTEALITRYLIASVIVVLAGWSLPIIGREIVHIMGWNEAFVGTVLIAFTTSLPEMAVTLAAIRVGAVDLAFANVLGSNLFNIAILGISDLFYFKGPLLDAVQPIHQVTGLITIMMTGLVLVALVHNPKRRWFNTVSGLSLTILLLYILNTLVLFRGEGP
ncbi:MAG: sodium:calcium antiporter [Bdellovibrionaceae bacterium]|nr:sodium:calcium antiporter [Bdellovibrionales bacterium]MCB9084128.1 sodium:calcium antiporter [Pseudobdellovibrionaceae bacterium]